MDDLVKEIREHIGHQWSDRTFVQSEKVRDIMRRAADEIERLESVAWFGQERIVKAWAVMKWVNESKEILDSAWPTKKQADESASFCSYPVRVAEIVANLVKKK